MKLLEPTFTESRWHHEQVWRDENYAIYKRWKDGGVAPHFETIRIQKNKAGERAFTDPKTGEKILVQCEACESYPSEKMWGKTGWTFADVESAKAKVTELQQPCKA